MKAVFVALLLLSSLNLCLATTSYDFRVTDATSGDPVSGAIITVTYQQSDAMNNAHPELAGTSVSGTTDANGVAWIELYDAGAKGKGALFLFTLDHLGPPNDACGKIVQSVTCVADGYNELSYINGDADHNRQFYVPSAANKPSGFYRVPDATLGFRFHLTPGDHREGLNESDGGGSAGRSGSCSGTWSGNVYYTDRGTKTRYTLSVDFDGGTAHTTANPSSAGRIVSVTSSDIVVDWPGGGQEEVTYSTDAGVLTASGSIRAYSDGRILPSSWRIVRQ